MSQHGDRSNPVVCPDVVPGDLGFTPATGGASRAPAYWRSLEEYAGTSEFREWAEREFPELATELDASYAEGGVSRRRFLQLMAASIALAGVAGLSGCRRNEERILPYNNKPAEAVPGRPMYYATTMVLAGQPIGLLAETHEGRPTKMEGNPLHPASQGATHAFAQASVLDLYDPERSRRVLHKGQAARWKEDFLVYLEKHVPELRPGGGAKLAILSEDYASPAIEVLREHLAKAMPHATFHVYEPAWFTAGAPPVSPVHDVSAADVILALDCDFLGLEDDGTRYQRQFASRRGVTKPEDGMNRLYVVEPCYTLTGIAADHHLRLKASAVGEYAKQLLAVLQGQTPQAMAGVDPRWLNAVADDLKSHPGKARVLVGRRQPQWVHEVAAAINQALGSPAASADRPLPAAASIADLAKRIAGGEVGTLLILGGNPAYDAPVDLDVPNLIQRVPVSIRLGLHEDETSSLCTWHIPAAHYLESWGDAIAADGTLSPVQPLVDPLFGGITPLELLARICAYDMADPYEIVRRSFRRVAGATDFETKWRRFLHEGVFMPKTAPTAAMAAPAPAPTTQPAGSKDGLEVCFSFSPSIFDGRFGNNAWMQECPDPITKLAWDNAALISPRTAEEHRVRSGEMARIELNGRNIEIPVLVLPGHADGSITLALGYGREVGAVAEGAGCNVYALRTSTGMGFATGAKLSGTGRRYALVSTQEHWKISEHHLVESTLKQRAIIREATLEHYRKQPDFVQRMGVEVEKDRKGVPLSIYTPPAMAGPHQWGMVIDLNKCIGCTACIVACQAENNIPVVGKDEVARGRAMHWIRLDRYFSGDPLGEVEVATQPMLCQQCENAPCEPVCPVNATVHSGEGLNQMIYNRCVGTRYCSNNCPYKVRRFNFFDYNKATLRQSAAAMRSGRQGPDPVAGWGQLQIVQPAPEEILKMQKNPQVTVRMRGVMEKCTYCVQRIEQAKIEAGGAQGQDPIAIEKGTGKNRVNGNPGGAPAVKVPDGTIRTACEQACPTQAIVFGDISDPNSRVAKLREIQRNYEVLEHLNVRPRTTYLARLRNVNPAMPAPSLLDQQRPAEAEVEA